MARTAVIINEFGEVSIDHLLVRQAAENIVELRNGCLCCSIRGDLVMTLRDLHEKRILGEIADFDYVVIETTGLADPVPILHTLMANPPVHKVFRPDVVIACADVLNVQKTVAEHPVAASQIAMADIVLMTKADLANPDQFARARALASNLNPGAETLLAEAGRVAASRLFRRALFEAGRDGDAVRSWLADGGGRTAAHAHDCTGPGCGHPGHFGHHDHGAEYTSFVLHSDGSLSLAGTALFLNRIVNRHRDDILRIKGLVHVTGKDDRPAVIHAVQDKFYPIERLDAWSAGDRNSRIVVIGRNLPQNVLQEEFLDLAAA